MRLLIVAMAESIHTSRWIQQLTGQGFEIQVFPSIPCHISDIHPDLKKMPVTVFHTRHPMILFRKITGTIQNMRRTAPDSQLLYSTILAHLIERIRPDIVHSMETQRAGYLVHSTKMIYKKQFPIWLHTNWGSDIYLFGRLKEHEQRIRDVLTSCDFYSCECHRDLVLARKFGYTGKSLPVFPNTGGFELEKLGGLRSVGKTSARRTIMLKGYQGWAGRALVALRALELCKDALTGYTVYLYSASADVHISAELFSNNTGIPVIIIPENTPHTEILKHQGNARISIGLSISDAISTSFLEALAMGSFPIQSWTACADEWVTDKKTGLLVDPEDPQNVAAAVREALTNDALVDAAVDINDATVKEKLVYEHVRAQALAMYRTIRSQAAAKDK